MSIINLTPHSINIEGMEEIPSSGIVRVSEITEVIGCFEGVQIIKKSFGEVIGLPEQKEGTIIVVSIIVAQACPDRNDLFVPGEVIRDEKGRIIGCKNLAK